MTNYVELAVKTESQPTLDQLKARLSRPNMIRLFIALQSLAICGEELDKLKKHVFYGRELPADPDIEPKDLESIPAGQTELNRLILSARTLHGVVGFATEAAELVTAYLKFAFHGEMLDSVNLGEEVGDAFWYAGVLSDEHGFTFDQIMETNIAKLQRRFPDKFDAARAIERDTNAERVILDSRLIPEDRSLDEPTFWEEFNRERA